MNQVKEYYHNILAQRRTLIDLVMIEHYQVKDSIGVSAMLESMSSKNIEKLFSCLEKQDEEVSTQILNELLVQNNNKKISAVTLNENVWQKQRNVVLEDSGSNERVDYSKLIKQMSIPALIAFAVKLRIDNPMEYKRFLVQVKNIIPKNYNRIRLAIQNATGKHILPDLSEPAKNVKKMLTTKDPELAKMYRSKIFSGTGSKVATFMKRSGYTILAAIGITALVLVCQKVFNKMNIQAHKTCKGSGKDKIKCILRFKINACNEIIKKFEEAVPACKDKKNPQKCELSIQKEIWHWNKRKAQYQDQLQKLEHVNVPSAFRK